MYSLVRHITHRSILDPITTIFRHKLIDFQNGRQGVSFCWAKGQTPKCTLHRELWKNNRSLQGTGVRPRPILPQAHPPSQVMYRFYFSSYRYRYLTVIIWKLWKKGSRKFLKLAFLKLNCITSMKPFQVFNCLNIAVSKIASHPKVHNSTLWREINVVGSICRNKLTRLTCRQCLAFLQTFHYPAPSQSTAHATTSTLSTSERLKLLRFSFSSSKDKKSYQLINNIV